MSNNNIRSYHYVYLITNNLNGKNYVGKHYGPLFDLYKGSGTLIRRALKKYGNDNFTKEILAVCNSEKDLKILETIYIGLYKSIGKAEYNLSKGGDGGALAKESRMKISESIKAYYKTEEGKLMKQHLHNVNLGRHQSEETKRLVSKRSNDFWNSPAGQREKEINSKRHTGRKQSKEEIEKRRQANIGKKRTFEQNKRNSEHIKELWQNPEYRNHMSNVHKGKPGTMKGKHFSEIAKQHMSEAHIGKHQSEEAKRKIGEAFRGRPISDKQREQISTALTGRHYYNNGIIEVKLFECPEGFVPGRLLINCRKRRNSNINDKE